MKYMLKHALAGGLFSASAVIAGSITWTLVQTHRDRKHMVEYWQKREHEEALKAHPLAIPLPRQADDSEAAEFKPAGRR